MLVAEESPWCKLHCDAMRFFLQRDPSERKQRKGNNEKGKHQFTILRVLQTSSALSTLRSSSPALSSLKTRRLSPKKTNGN